MKSRPEFYCCFMEINIFSLRKCIIIKQRYRIFCPETKGSKKSWKLHETDGRLCFERGKVARVYDTEVPIFFVSLWKVALFCSRPQGQFLRPLFDAQKGICVFKNSWFHWINVWSDTAIVALSVFKVTSVWKCKSERSIFSWNERINIVLAINK